MTFHTHSEFTTWFGSRETDLGSMEPIARLGAIWFRTLAMKTCRQPEGISLQQITGNKELDIENKVSRTSEENLKQAQIIEGPPFPKYIP